MKIPFTNIEIGVQKKEPIEVKSSIPYDLGGTKIYGTRYPIISKSFDGEKTLGELGVVLNAVPDYTRLRLRAYSAEMLTDVVKIISDRFFQWVIGNGLKLQAEPNEDLLELENIEDNFKEIKRIIEARFQVYSNSKHADYSKMNNLHQKAKEAYKTSWMGGDCLVVCRIENLNLNVQIIDGIHVCDPIGSKYFEEANQRKNFIKHGIEFNDRGEHVAYYVKKKTLEYERISVYGEKSKRKLAWLLYGNKQRVDHLRGIPEISQILEKLNKLDRYAEAAVGKAEQAAKITYAIVHEQYSTGEDIMQEIANKKKNIVVDPNANQNLADDLANKITETTSNQTFNMPVGSKLMSFDTNIETNFEQFYKAVINSLCASVGVPPEVAQQMYNSNYSASRAAINAFGYVVDLARETFANDFYKPIYQLYLEIEILKGKIPANGYLVALQKDDFMVIEAYSQSRFIGKNMPHIDPLKEVKAVSEMLSLELISREQATEILNQGDWWSNIEKKKIEDEEHPQKEEMNNNLNQNTNDPVQSSNNK